MLLQRVQTQDKVIITKEYAPLGAQSIFQLDRTAFMFHFHWKNRSSLIFQMLQRGKFDLIISNQHRNKKNICINFFSKIQQVTFARVLIRYCFMSCLRVHSKNFLCPIVPKILGPHMFSTPRTQAVKNWLLCELICAVYIVTLNIYLVVTWYKSDCGEK